MAVAFDASGGSTVANASSLTYSHTCTGSNLTLYVSAVSGAASRPVSGITYNSVAMTLVTSTSDANGNQFYLYALISPSTGANNVVVSVSGGTVPISSQSASFTGTNQSNISTVKGTSGGNNTGTGSQSLTSTVDNSAMFAAVFAATSEILTAGSGTTKILYTAGSNADGLCIYDSSPLLITPSGSKTLNWAFGASTPKWMSIAIMVEPPAAPITYRGNFLAFM